MAQIVPTITAENPHVYREQIERVQGFAKRIHIDLMDGVFTPNKSLATNQVWLPELITTDIHVMFQKPENILSTLILLKPNLIILPAESSFNFSKVVKQCQQSGIKLGLALLPETHLETLKIELNSLDHLLIFSGNLGYQGGSTADLKLLEKVESAKKLNPKLEIGWDGGVNDTNVQILSASGVEIINTGGYIHSADNPSSAYQTLTNLII